MPLAIINSLVSPSAPTLFPFFVSPHTFCTSFSPCVSCCTSICQCEWVRLLVRARKSTSSPYHLVGAAYRKTQLFLSVCFLPLCAFHPSTLSILQFFILTAEFSRCELRSPFCSPPLSHSCLPPCVSPSIIISASAVPYCWESNVIIIFPLSSSPFLPLSFSLWLPLIHYPSLTTLLCCCEVDPTLGCPSLLTEPLYLSIYPPSFLPPGPLTVSLWLQRHATVKRDRLAAVPLNACLSPALSTTLYTLVSVTVASVAFPLFRLPSLRPLFSHCSHVTRSSC